VRYEYAQLLRDLNVQDEALKQAKEAIRIEPKMPEAHRLLGTLEIAENAALEREFSPTLAEWPGTLELLVRVNGVPAPLVHVDLRRDDEGLADVGLETDVEGRITGAPIFAGSWSVTVTDPLTSWSTVLPDPLPVLAGQATVRTLDLERP